MKKLKSLVVALVCAAVMLGLAGCTVQGTGQQASSSASSASVQVSVSSTAAQSSSSAVSSNVSASSSAANSQPSQVTVTEDGTYTSKDEVALYIHLYGHVPSNYVTKTKARKAGWVNTEGNLWDVLPGMSIGGGGFFNDDGMMPDAPGREWFECDIDYEGGYRNAKRLVYSNDGLIFYTDDHYETFEQLY